MSYERDEAMRQQTATEAMIEMREPSHMERARLARGWPTPRNVGIAEHISALRVHPSFELADRHDPVVYRLRQTFEYLSSTAHSYQELRELHRRDAIGLYVNRDQQAAWRGYVEGFILGAGLPL